MALRERDIESSVAALWPREPAQAGVLRRLADRYGDRVDLEIVAGVVQCAFAAFAEATVTLYIPILAERRADQQLRVLASNRQTPQTSAEVS